MVLKQLIANFTQSPIIEYSSGRPLTSSLARIPSGLRRVSGSAFGWRGHVVALHPRRDFRSRQRVSQQRWTTFTVPLVAPPAAASEISAGTVSHHQFFPGGYARFPRIPLGERFKIDVIADRFQSAHATNIAAVNQLCDPLAGSTCSAGQPTASYDARQFQFALKLSW